MKHSIELFKAANTTYDTPNKIQFKLLLGSVAAYNGEIPLTRNEIKDRLSISVSALKRILAESKYTGEIYEKDGRLFVNPTTVIDFNAETSNSYVKHFKFLSTTEFKEEDRRVQRFVLDMLCQHVYLKNRKYVTYLKNLINSGSREFGTFNIRTVGEMKQIIEKAGKYLDLQLDCRNTKDWLVIVHGLKPEYETLGSYDSEGAMLWVSQKLYAAGFVVEVIEKSVKNQLAKVMEYYYSQLGYELAYKVFVGALDDLLYSSAFHSMVYANIDNDKQLNEISAYFRHVAEASERFVALGLALDYEKLNNIIDDVTRIAVDEGSEPSTIQELHQAKILKDSLKLKIAAFETLWINNHQKGNHYLFDHQKDNQVALRHMKDLQSLLYEYWVVSK